MDSRQLLAAFRKRHKLWESIMRNSMFFPSDPGPRPEDRDKIEGWKARRLRFDDPRVQEYIALGDAIEAAR